MNKIILKFRIKNLLLDFVYYAIVFLFAWLFDKVLEISCFILTYTLIRNEFSKAIHGKDFTESSYKGIVYCRYITFCIQLISLVFLITIDLSKYINLILAFILGIINFFAKDYLEYVIATKVVFYKGMKAHELPKDLAGIEYDIMYYYYVERYKLDKIALCVNYSVDNVKKLKAKIIKRYS